MLSYLRKSELEIKEAISYFVDLMGVSTEAIDALSHAGITISRRHLDRQKAIIADEHQRRVASYIQKSKNSTMARYLFDINRGNALSKSIARAEYRVCI
jgi:hypothetical protein